MHTRPQHSLFFNGGFIIVNITCVCRLSSINHHHTRLKGSELRLVLILGSKVLLLTLSQNGRPIFAICNVVRLGALYSYSSADTSTLPSPTPPPPRAFHQHHSAPPPCSFARACCHRPSYLLCTPLGRHTKPRLPAHSQSSPRQGGTSAPPRGHALASASLELVGPHLDGAATEDTLVEELDGLGRVARRAEEHLSGCMICSEGMGVIQRDGDDSKNERGGDSRDAGDAGRDCNSSCRSARCQSRGTCPRGPSPRRRAARCPPRGNGPVKQAGS